MEKDPHQVLEGHPARLLRHQGDDGVRLPPLRVRPRLPHHCRRRSTRRYAAGLLGQEHPRHGLQPRHLLHRGAGAYICGEETGLIESLEGKRAWPRIKPPFPAIEGAFRKPTVVNNVETLACVPHIIDRGVDWFKSIGVPPDPKNPRDAGSYGPKLYCSPATSTSQVCVELPLGVTVRELIDEHGGGVWKGRKAKAVDPRRDQHGLRCTSAGPRLDIAARLRRPGQGRLPRPGHRGRHGHRRPDEHGRRAATTSAGSSPTRSAASARPAARGPAGCSRSSTGSPRAGPARGPRHPDRGRPTTSASCPGTTICGLADGAGWPVKKAIRKFRPRVRGVHQGGDAEQVREAANDGGAH